MEDKVYDIVDSVETLEAKIAQVRAAEKIFANFTQEQVDKIFFAAATAANQMRIPLAKMAVEETGMGVKTTSLPNIFTTHIDTQRLAAFWKRIKNTALKKLPSLSVW